MLGQQYTEIVGFLKKYNCFESLRYKERYCLPRAQCYMQDGHNKNEKSEPSGKGAKHSGLFSKEQY